MAKTQKQTNVIKIKLVKSLIGSSETQKRVVAALGLRKMNQVVEHSNTPTIMGMVKKVPHLVEVIDG